MCVCVCVYVCVCVLVCVSMFKISDPEEQAGRRKFHSIASWYQAFAFLSRIPVIIDKLKVFRCGHLGGSPCLVERNQLCNIMIPASSH